MNHDPEYCDFCGVEVDGCRCDEYKELGQW